MKIDVFCEMGSMSGVTEKSIYGEDGRIGLGGAEIALLTMCAGWQASGHSVRLYNNPTEYGASSFEQLNMSAFNPDESRDVLISFRTPNHLPKSTKGMKLWWSCDQYTVGDFKSFSQRVDKIVTISPRHSKYFRDTYGIENTKVIDLPVRMQDYCETLPKIKNRCIFTSIPDRGLMQLHAAWPLILKEVPDASLVITSDWRLWDPNLPESIISDYRLRFAHQNNVKYLGAVKRMKLVEEQLQAEFLTFPNIYDELFCLTVAEAQVAGAYPITSDFGSLGTTNMGTVIEGNPYSPEWIDEFVYTVVDMMKNPHRTQMDREMTKELAMKRFSLETVMAQWEEVFSGADNG